MFKAIFLSCILIPIDYIYLKITCEYDIALEIICSIWQQFDVSFLPSALIFVINLGIEVI